MSDERGNPAEPEELGRSRFVGLHARTFEMELLLSGAVVFGLVQLPPVVHRLGNRLLAGLAGTPRYFVIIAEGYVAIMLYTLIGAFLLHLISRAFWIGLLGLESVFPGGIAWDRLQLGTRTRDCYRRELPSLARLVDRVDDLCSLIFSFGFLIIASFVYSVVVIALTTLIAAAVSQLWPGGADAVTVLWMLLAALIGVQLVVPAIDKQLGARLSLEGRASRWLGGLTRLAYRVSPMRWVGVVQLTLVSNLSPARVSAAMFCVALALGLGYAGSAAVDAGRVSFDSRAYYPARLREQGIDPLHYRDRRPGDAAHPTYPSIQSEILLDPYAVLSIPYLPRFHDPLLAAGCSALRPLRAEGFWRGRDEAASDEEVRAVAECFATLFPVELDGAATTTPRFEFSIEPDSRLPALIAHIPLSGLAAGRHELTVTVPGHRRRVRSEPGAVERHRIPFWR